MNKLTTLHAARITRAARPRRQDAAAAVISMTEAVPANRSRGLSCTWTRDPATGRLECRWSLFVEPDRSCAWRLRRHAQYSPPRACAA
jgi:hypothetical protein